jgi:hypothetical protein
MVLAATPSRILRSKGQIGYKTVADVIRIHRQQHAERLLNQACQMVLQTRDLSEVLARFTFAPAPT